MCYCLGHKEYKPPCPFQTLRHKADPAPSLHHICSTATLIVLCDALKYIYLSLQTLSAKTAAEIEPRIQTLSKILILTESRGVTAFGLRCGV